MIEPDFGLQVDLALRLLVAAVLGAVIGLEREIHAHSAGMRTHLLVSLGSAAFTVLSIFGFPGPVSDPSRVAAQIVTGVGFLGAGAILKEGATVRGLTTAASLWAVAGVGMAAGAGAWGVALAVTLIVIVSLWPLRRITERYIGRDQQLVRMRLSTTDPHRVGAIVEAVGGHGASIAHMAIEHGSPAGLIVDVEARLPDVASMAQLIGDVAALDGVTMLESRALGD